MLFANLEALREHLKKTCPKMRFYCSRCDEKFTKEAGHKCDKYIKQLEEQKAITEQKLGLKDA